jgi:glycosyltransferase involved in cell wall biosynthesis
LLKITFVTHFQPSEVGHGGNHRAYQIQHDLIKAVGSENLNVVAWPDWEAAVNAKPSIMRQLDQFLDWLVRKIKARLRWWGIMKLKPGHVSELYSVFEKKYSDPRFVAYYKASLTEGSRPDICIVEHPGFIKLLEINRSYGIPTFACLQNLESLDLAPRTTNTEHLQLISDNFRSELTFIANCQQHFPISKVETAVLRGLGYPAHYYPYRPVGALRERLLQIREARRTQKQEADLFLMPGTVLHNTTREGFEWFLQQMTMQPLSQPVRIRMLGLGAILLQPLTDSLPCIENYDWVEQDELDEWLIRAQAVIVPHFRGFGALTRLPELSCAGIPVLTSTYAAQTMDVPPGVLAVDQDWALWRQAIEILVKHPPEVDQYDSWHTQQTSMVEQTIQQLISVADSSISGIDVNTTPEE